MIIITGWSHEISQKLVLFMITFYLSHAKFNLILRLWTNCKRNHKKVLISAKVIMLALMNCCQIQFYWNFMPLFKIEFLSTSFADTVRAKSTYTILVNILQFYLVFIF